MYKYLLCLFLLPVLTYAISPYDAPQSPKDVWLGKLRYCESQNRDHITVMDTNNKYSYGGLQFQLETFMGFGKQYGILPKELTNEEGLLLIHNPYIQRGIALEMLNDNLSYHWKNCRDKIGYAYPLSDT